MKSNLMNKFLVLFTIFISILSNFTIETHAYSITTYNKSEEDMYISPIGGGFFVLRDGSKLLRFYRPSLENPNCNEPDLHLRILKKDGTLTPFIVKNFTPPIFNYCRADPLITSNDYIVISKLSRGDTPNFNIFYYNISDTNRELPFGRFVAQVNMEGEIVR
jgi:hypothetical protein